MNDTKQSILVTGAGGFVGSLLCQALLDDGHTVIGLDRNPQPTSLTSNKGLIWIQKDLYLDTIQPNECPPFDTVYHLAALLSAEEPGLEEKLIRSNEISTIKIFKYCAAQKVKKIIYASTQMIYGDPNSTSVDESFPIGSSLTAYGLSKLHGENWLRYFCQKNSFQGIIFRMTGFVEAQQSLVNFLLTKASHHESIELFSKGTICRDYLSIHDTIHAFVSVLHAKNFATACEVFNLGSGQSISTLELAQFICQTVQSQSQIILMDQTAPRSNFVFNIEKAQQNFKFNPKPLTESVQLYIKDQIR